MFQIQLQMGFSSAMVILFHFIPLAYLRFLLKGLKNNRGKKSAGIFFMQEEAYSVAWDPDFILMDKASGETRFLGAKFKFPLVSPASLKSWETPKCQFMNKKYRGI